MFLVLRALPHELVQIRSWSFRLSDEMGLGGRGEKYYLETHVLIPCERSEVFNISPKENIFHYLTCSVVMIFQFNKQVLISVRGNLAEVDGVIFNGNSAARVSGAWPGHRWPWFRGPRSAPDFSEPMPLACGLKLAKSTKLFLGFLQTGHLILMV